MNIGGIGSRTFSDKSLALKTLSQYFKPEDVLVSGGAIGADSIAEQIIDTWGCKKIIHYPDWAKFGRSAGYIRNQLIVDDADMVIAFWDGSSRGTRDSIKRARKANKKVVTVLFTYGTSPGSHPDT